MDYGGMLIGGKWQETATQETIAIFSPSDGKEIGRVAARHPSRHRRRGGRRPRAPSRAPGASTPAVERGRLLSQARRARSSTITRSSPQIEARDTGKPMAQARADIDATRPLLRVLRRRRRQGARRDHPVSRRLPGDDPARAARRHRPHHPVELPGADVRAHARRRRSPRATPRSLKPAEEACLALVAPRRARDRGRLARRRDQRRHRAAARRRAPRSRRIRASTSCPSPARPRSARWCSTAAALNHVPCMLELGGKSPQIVFDDADLERRVPVVVKAIVQNAGQTCSAGSRVLVGALGIRAVHAARSATRFSKLRVGPHGAGPRLRPGDQPRSSSGASQGFIASRPRSGHRGRREGPIVDERADPGGFYVTPTLFGLVPRGASASRRRRCSGRCSPPSPSTTRPMRSGSPTAPTYGLVAGVWTENGGRQMRVAKRRARRPGLHQRLRRGRRHRAALRRGQASPATAARRASRRCASSPSPRRSCSTTADDLEPAHHLPRRRAPQLPRSAPDRGGAGAARHRAGGDPGPDRELHDLRHRRPPVAGVAGAQGRPAGDRRPRDGRPDRAARAWRR